MLKLNRNVFFAEVRRGPFPGRLTKSQVDGMNNLLDVWEERGTDDERHLAYILATNFHETGQKMQPVREGFKSTDKEARAYVQRNYGHKGQGWYCWPQGPYGHVYYGRGDVQNTWLDNYTKMERILGVPLVKNPDLALDPKISKLILVEGMLRGVSARGDFTGKALEDYFNTSTDDPTGARRIVNGTDKAFLIAGYHDEFLDAIEAASVETTPTVVPVALPVEVPTKPPVTDGVSWGGAITVLGGLGSSAAALSEKLGGVGVAVAVAAIVIGALMIARGRLNIVKRTGE